MTLGAQRLRGNPQPPPPRPQLPPNLLAWRSCALQALGWQSKAGQQTALLDEVTTQRQQLEATALQPGGADALAALAKGSGKEFTSYQTALRNYERANPKSPELAEALWVAAQGYINHFNSHPKRLREDKKNIAKRDACVETLSKLRQFALIDQVAGQGNPPWDSNTARQVAALKATLDLDPYRPGSSGRSGWMAAGCSNPSGSISRPRMAASPRP